MTNGILKSVNTKDKFYKKLVKIDVDGNAQYTTLKKVFNNFKNTLRRKIDDVMGNIEITCFRLKIAIIIVSSSHFERNIFIYGPPVAITDIVNCLQHFCKYFIRISQCYFSLYVLIYNTWPHHAMTVIVYLCLIIIMTLVNYLMTPIHRC